MTASHFAWESVYGPLPKGLCILHKCDNPICVRPDSAPGTNDGHLFAGTRKDNAIDCWQKGRGKKSRTNVILTEAVASEARILRAAGWTLKQIGEKYGASVKTIERTANATGRADGRWIDSWNVREKQLGAPRRIVVLDVKDPDGQRTLTLECGHVVRRVVHRGFARCWGCAEAIA